MDYCTIQIYKSESLVANKMGDSEENEEDQTDNIGVSLSFYIQKPQIPFK